MTWLNVRLTLAFIDASRIWIDDDLISALLVAGVLSANVEPTHQNPGIAAEASSPGGLPDELRRPVNAMSIALSLGVPRETARVKLAALLERGTLQRRDKGVILGNDVILSEPLMAAMGAFLKAIAEFVEGLSALEACGVLQGDHLATPPWAIGGVATRIVTTHVLRGIDYAREVDPALSLTTHYILLALSHLTGAALRVTPNAQEDGGQIALGNPSLVPVSVAHLARFTRLPHETVRRQVNHLKELGVVVRHSRGWDIDLSDASMVSRWLDFQNRTTVSTRQVVWKMYSSSIIVRGPTHGLTLGVFTRQ